MTWKHLPPVLGKMSDQALAWVWARGGVWLSGQCLSNSRGRSMRGSHAVCRLPLRPRCHAYFRKKTLHAVKAFYVTKPMMWKVQVNSYSYLLPRQLIMWGFEFPYFEEVFVLCQSFLKQQNKTKKAPHKNTFYFFLNCNACESKNTSTGVTQANST